MGTISLAPRTLAIAGVGLIGGSVALAARRRWPAIQIRTIDNGDPLEGVRGADLVVLAAPVDVIVAILPRLPALLDAHALVTDTGSVKRVVLRAAGEAGLSQFVGGHPLAGGTTAGSGAARVDLFDGRAWFLMTNSPAPTVLDRASAVVEALGARAVRFEDEGQEHDRLMAALSHLPQLVASALMTVAGETAGRDALQWAGTGLRDTTRLAASPPGIWEGVVESNQDEIRPLLKALATHLETLSDRLGDRAFIRDFFETASRLKASCL